MEFPYHKRIVSSPAVSRNRVYLSATDGLHSLSIDLSQEVIDTLAPGSAASCAIGPDGRVYVVTKDGELRAYAGLEDP